MDLRPWRRVVLPLVVGTVLLVCVAPVEDPWIRLTFASDDVCDWATNNGISCGPVRAVRPLTTVTRYAAVAAWLALCLIPRRPRLRTWRIALAAVTLVSGFLPLWYLLFLAVRAG